MPRRKTYTGFNNPFLLWTELAMKTGEMMLASASVIDHRTRRMSAAGAQPSARDRREFGVMRDEKIKATNQASQAMTAQFLRTDPLLWVRAYQQMVAVTTAMMSLAASRTINQLFERQARLMRTLSGSITPMFAFSAATARLAQRGLTPIHSRATANARRLGK
ncbi:MAG: hypothetical protein L0H63_12890 [Nitrococcus sp.]|nr:hypothetical protein [Nitrococcus sp.]